jgi:hypothetical protein
MDKSAQRNQLHIIRGLFRLKRGGAYLLIKNIARSYDGMLMSAHSKSDRRLHRRANRKFCLAIVLVALCVFVQAVRAKSARYAGTTPQTRYFTSSIKIARFVPLDVATPLAAAIPVPFYNLQEPRLASLLPVIEFVSRENAPPATTVLPRSPPLAS